MNKVIKRNGQEVDFCIEKIEKAISAANNEVEGADKISIVSLRAIVDEVERRCEKASHALNVEDIQNIVEEVIMEEGYFEVARRYIKYRYLHGMIRDQYQVLMSEVAKKLDATDIQNQNANVDEASFGGRQGEASNYLTSQYALDYCMSKTARENHLNNEIYTHDLSSYAVGSHNCLTIPFDDLLAKGFTVRQTDVRPAQSVSTAFQLLAVIFQIQSLQQFGGVSASHLDWTMVPYVRKSFYKYALESFKYFDDCVLDYLFVDENDNPRTDIENIPLSDYENIWVSSIQKQYCYDKIEKEIHQAVEGMYHNLNTLQSRSGNQLPFTSINYGTCTLPEGRMVIKALLDVSIDGIGKLHRTSIFPCGIFQVMKGVNKEPGTPNYDLFRLALKSTAQRLYPNYANVDWSGNEGYDRNDPRTYFSTMGCRTANGWDINGFGQLKDGRGNICPVTIILPTLAMEVKVAMIEQYGAEVVQEDQSHLVDRFMNYLDKKIFEAKDQLIERFEWICKQSPEAAKFMYENNVMAGYIPEEGIRSALKHGTLAIGLLGMAEALQILIGCNQLVPEGMELAKRICQLYKTRCQEFKQEYKLNFGVYYTPAENLCYTAMKKFQKKYGKIKNISDRDFFTNSIHVPVWEQIDIFKKIDIESQLTGYSSAGCITYVELDAGVKNNLDALETIVNYAMDHDIPYFAINVPNDMCMSCGYTDEIGDECPMCGGKTIRRLRRVTGYLTGDYKTAFNLGKQEETEARFKHSAITNFTKRHKND